MLNHPRDEYLHRYWGWSNQRKYVMAFILWTIHVLVHLQLTILCSAKAWWEGAFTGGMPATQQIICHTQLRLGQLWVEKMGVGGSQFLGSYHVLISFKSRHFFSNWWLCDACCCESSLLFCNDAFGLVEGNVYSKNYPCRWTCLPKFWFSRLVVLIFRAVHIISPYFLPVMLLFQYVAVFKLRTLVKIRCCVNWD